MAFERKYVDVDGVSTAYVEAGRGPVILLVHGGDYQSFAHSSDWHLNLEGLAARGFRAVALDKYGQGYTGIPADPSGYTMDAVCRHLAGFAAALRLTHITVVGHSRGALPAARLALDSPGLVRRLVIADSGSIAPRPTPALDFYTRAYQGMTDRPTAEMVDREALMNSFSDAHLTPEYRASRLEVALGRNSIEARRVMDLGARESVFLPSTDSVREGIHARIRDGQLQIDTLVVWGRDDPSGPVEIAPRVLDLIASPNAKRTELHVFNQAGHYAYREHPERFNEVLAGFASA